jgi:hypothetical protein
MLSLVSPCHTGPLRFLPRTPVSIDTVLNGPTNAKIPIVDGVLLFGSVVFRPSKTYKFRQAWKVIPEADLPPTEEETATDTDAQKAARQRDDDMVHRLTLALEKQAPRFKIKEMTAAWPRGRVHLIVKALLKKFRARDAMSELEFESVQDAIWAACMKRKTVETNADIVPLSIKHAHLRLGHMNEETTRKTAKLLGWELSTGSISPCANCANGKRVGRRFSRKMPVLQ